LHHDADIPHGGIRHDRDVIGNVAPVAALGVASLDASPKIHQLSWCLISILLSEHRTMIRILLAGVLGGALVFGGGALSHSVLQLEGRHIERLPDEAKFREFVNKEGVPPGMFGFPSLPADFASLPPEEQTKQWDRVNELYKKGPSAFVIVAPSGEEMMGIPQLGGEAVSNVLAALIVAFVLCRTSPDTGYVMRFLIVVLFGVFTWLSTSASYALWYRFPWPFILDGFYCSLIEWGMAGLVMAAIAKGTPPATPPPAS
jgi:hypothetical protein